MVNIDNYHRHVSNEIITLLTHYIDFNKDRKGFEKFIQKKLKEAEKKAKSQENKEVTAKEKSEVPVK